MPDLEAIKRLRELTGAGMMDAKRALEEAGGSVEQAVDVLRKAGVAKAAKKAERTASQGLVEVYLHGGRIGVVVEINCETDFVARTDDFKQLARDVAMQIAAAHPEYISPEEVPEALIEKEKEIYRAELEGKPEAVVDKILTGKLDKFYSEICLLKQPFIKDPSINIEQLVTDLIAKLGENIVIRRMSRIELGADG
jgi:elongation factor Ts